MIQALPFPIPSTRTTFSSTFSAIHIHQLFALQYSHCEQAIEKVLISLSNGSIKSTIILESFPLFIVFFSFLTICTSKDCFPFFSPAPLSLPHLLLLPVAWPCCSQHQARVPRCVLSHAGPAPAPSLPSAAAVLPLPPEGGIDPSQNKLWRIPR